VLVFIRLVADRAVGQKCSRFTHRAY